MATKFKKIKSKSKLKRIKAQRKAKPVGRKQASRPATKGRIIEVDVHGILAQHEHKDVYIAGNGLAVKPAYGVSDRLPHEVVRHRSMEVACAKRALHNTLNEAEKIKEMSIVLGGVSNG